MAASEVQAGSVVGSAAAVAMAGLEVGSGAAVALAGLAAEEVDYSHWGMVSQPEEHMRVADAAALEGAMAAAEVAAVAAEAVLAAAASMSLEQTHPCLYQGKGLQRGCQLRHCLYHTMEAQYTGSTL